VIIRVAADPRPSAPWTTGMRRFPLRPDGANSPRQRVADLPDHRDDPLDRLLVAQAQELAMPIVIADHQLSAYSVDLVLA
jgi:PIN domain nuclease of toxin-antitoxin system